MAHRRTHGNRAQVLESYTVTHPLSVIGWFIIDTIHGSKDRPGDLRGGMPATLDRLAAIAEEEYVP